LKHDLAREVEESASKYRRNVEKSILNPILKSMSADRNSAYRESKVTSPVTPTTTARLRN